MKGQSKILSIVKRQVEIIVVVEKIEKMGIIK